MIEFDPNYDDIDTIKAIRAKAMANLVSGITITSFTSEGTTLTGFSSAKTEDIITATTRFLDAYYGNLVTETQPNFLS